MANFENPLFLPLFGGSNHHVGSYGGKISFSHIIINIITLIWKKKVLSYELLSFFYDVSKKILEGMEGVFERNEKSFFEVLFQIMFNVKWRSNNSMQSPVQLFPKNLDIFVF